jgi:DNA polymerase III alpha subunit
MTGFKCAYSKTHFPVLAYTGWLKEAREKQKPLEEMAELVDDAKYFGIDVYPPDITDLFCNFYTDGESITYGISNVKGVGETTARETIALIKEVENRFDPPKSIKNFTWYEFLVLCGYRIKKTVMENLIKVGAFRKFGLKRQQLLAEYEAICEVNEKEMVYLLENMNRFTDVASLMENAARKKEKGGAGGACHNKQRADKLLSRVEMLRNPIQPYVDTPNEIATDEANLLGIAITCSLADGKPGERWTVTCKDCLKDTLPKVIILKVKVEEVKEHILKRGKEENIGRTMAFLRLSDATCSLSDVSVFCDQWDQFKDLLCVGRVLEIHLEKGHKDNRLHVEHVWEI